MKLKKIITILITSLSLATVGLVAVNVNQPNTVKAFNVGFKKGLPKHFKHSWIGKAFKYDHQTSANFIVKNGQNYHFVTSRWNQNGQNEVNKRGHANFKFKYSLKIGKKKYLLATKSNSRKYLLIVKFLTKKTMKYGFAEITTKGKLYRFSDYFTMTAASRHATKKALSRNLSNYNPDQNNRNDNNN